MVDTTHLKAHMAHTGSIEMSLSRERIRLAEAKTVRELTFRKFSVSQIEKELTSHKEFLKDKFGIVESAEKTADDQLLNDLFN